MHVLADAAAFSRAERDEWRQRAATAGIATLDIQILNLYDKTSPCFMLTDFYP
jgi:predicted kinase